MKRLTIILLIGAASGGVTLFAKPGTNQHGTDILHYSVTKSMSNDGVESNALGSVKAHQNEQGHADNQQLNISVSGLTASNTYELLANGDTNLADGVSFTTDANGSASLQYRSMGNGHGHGGGLGHGKSQLPQAFNPVSSASQIDVMNSSTQAVLTADMTTPDSLQYLIKRNLSTSTVGASLRIHATTGQTQFKLSASGLNATNNYLLVLNGAVAQTYTPDTNGNLQITSLPYSGGILTLNSLALWDSSSNVVLQTSLPSP